MLKNTGKNVSLKAKPNITEIEIQRTKQHLDLLCQTLGAVEMWEECGFTD